MVFHSERSGSVQLLLYSVFHMGNATNNISWESYQDLARFDGVAWAVPLSLGDSHRGYRVLGTTAAFFERYRHALDQPLQSALKFYREDFERHIHESACPYHREAG